MNQTTCLVIFSKNEPVGCHEIGADCKPVLSFEHVLPMKNGGDHPIEGYLGVIVFRGPRLHHLRIKRALSFKSWASFPCPFNWDDCELLGQSVLVEPVRGASEMGPGELKNLFRFSSIEAQQETVGIDDA